jgi:hypothetical protein
MILLDFPLLMLFIIIFLINKNILKKQLYKKANCILQLKVSINFHYFVVLILKFLLLIVSVL